MTLVLKYGARRGGDDVYEQMRLGHEYYNQLVAAENMRRRAGWGGEKAPTPPEHECPRDEDKRAHCAVCKDHWYAVRGAVREQPHLNMIALRRARPGGLFWGTYLQIEEAFGAAVKHTDTIDQVSFRSRDHSMLAAVQIQDGVDHDSCFRLERQVDARQGRRARGELGRHTIQIRIGSTPSRQPLWSMPIRFEMHRPIRGRVVWVKITCSKHADLEKWYVQFVVEGNRERKRPDDGLLAIDVSWRRIDGELRIAMAQDLGGNNYELRMSSTWLECAARADRIQAERARLANLLIESDSRFARNKSARGCWRTYRGITEPEPELIAWAQRERHLWQYECGCRRRTVDMRVDAVRKWLRSLANRYATVVVKNSQHKEMKEKHYLPQKAQYQGQIGAPGEVIEWIRRLWGDEQMRVVDAAWTTALCGCGQLMDVGAQRVVHCERCGAETDRDLSSTRNMLARSSANEWKPPTVRKKTSRFAKRHKKTSEELECLLDG